MRLIEIEIEIKSNYVKIMQFFLQLHVSNVFFL